MVREVLLGHMLVATSRSDELRARKADADDKMMYECGLAVFNEVKEGIKKVFIMESP